MVLAQEIARVAAQPGESGGGAPMLADRLRISRAEQAALAVLANREVGRNAAVGIDGVLRAA
jgi:hypothetical protein